MTTPLKSAVLRTVPQNDLLLGALDMCRTYQLGRVAEFGARTGGDLCSRFTALHEGTREGLARRQFTGSDSPVSDDWSKSTNLEDAHVGRHHRPSDNLTRSPGTTSEDG